MATRPWPRYAGAVRWACFVFALGVSLGTGCATKQTQKPEASAARTEPGESEADLLDRAYQLLVHRRPAEALEVLRGYEKTLPSQNKGERTELMLVALCAAGHEQDALAMAAKMGEAKARWWAKEAAATKLAAGERTKSVTPFGFTLVNWSDLLEHNGATDCARNVEAEHERHYRGNAGPCPAEIEDDVTVLFGDRVAIRVPRSVSLVEEGPFVASAKTPTASTCDAVIHKMAVFLLEEIDPTEDLGEKTKKLLEKNDFKNGVFAPPELADGKEHRQVVEFAAVGDKPAVTVYAVLQRGSGLQVVVWYQAKPDQFPKLAPSFRDSAESIVLRR